MDTQAEKKYSGMLLKDVIQKALFKRKRRVVLIIGFFPNAPLDEMDIPGDGVMYCLEPEMHMFPLRQKIIIENLIRSSSALISTSNVIFTHSPYVLATINNLLFAGMYGKIKPEGVSKIISKELWIDIDDVDAYFVEEDGQCRDIMDRARGMIRSEEIDTVSVILNKEFDAMLDLESSEEYILRARRGVDLT